MNHPLIDRLAADERVQIFSSLQDSGQSPYYRTMTSSTGATSNVEGVDRIMLGSNNYLGLARHPEVIEATTEAVRRFGSASTGSRLLNGTMSLHEELEAEIADWFGTDDALCFSTGYQTNLGTLGALVGPRDAVVIDEYAHASLRDGLRMAQTSVLTFRHNDLDALEEALVAARGGSPDQVLVVVDSLYSMEGSLAPLAGIADLAREFGAALMVDEAHAMGLYGPTRRGWVEETGTVDAVDVTMASFSKSSASCGGFITGSSELVTGLRVTARPMIFSTSSVPAATASSLASIKLMRTDEGAARTEAVRLNSLLLRSELGQNGIDCGSGHSGAFWSPIVPVPIGDDFRAVHVWNLLLERGVYTGVAVHPAVPATGAILRLCVTADHTEEQLVTAARAIADVLALTRPDTAL
ncbi:pyridoxal phosphate-dependent aminotransferase family protein [Rhodococcus sp. IEGM 1408]|uniref:aminotransferase class I/II-fold pyridoxal phosphate-dependent enzyme n=1 Tax=Rhodococcus sp. IEGM 1408 TaxID=3082220 RepID=UPI002954F0E9|nr:pyridoxal phosphate-dependent aminotransferase family protein [Rhodococcus sp. IEGM 1408]MDV8000959.1 pyridoxal phosphate-dependent aminotransferase family protein [Rhodococcus sp. IEGM 1408]